MGLVIGLAGWVELRGGKLAVALRGAILGGFVSLASALSTEARDVPSFFAGIVYGAIIDSVATWLGERK